MLAVTLFILFWVLIAGAIIFIALRGGVSGARQTLQSQSRTAQGVSGVVFAFIIVGFGIAAPALLLVGNHRNASKRVAGVRLTAGEKNGRVLFGERCAVCHSLASADAVGLVGPNLDMLKPPKSLVLNTLKYGCLPNAPSGDPQTCLGYGVMPANIIAGAQADDVASYVAAVAGR